MKTLINVPKSLFFPIMIFTLWSCSENDMADSAGILSIDHYVPVVSRVPSMVGSVAQLYVREKVQPGVRESNDLEGQVVLFIHGAGTPAEVAFDPPYAGRSWMAYLAARGMDTFSVDMTGYGRSTRPLVMNDPCNLSGEQQEQVFGDSCSPSYRFAATTIESDWEDIDQVVDYLRRLRNVDTVHLVAWSLGGPRSAGYAARHPDKVGNIVLLAPAYLRGFPATRAEADFSGAAMTKQSEADFIANWDRQVGCDNQYTTAVSDAVWLAMLESDPVGATWGAGVRRAPRTVIFGWTPEVVADTNTPMLLVAGAQDAQVNPQLVRDLYEDLGSSQKVYLEMDCSSHNAMWESDAGQLFDASYQWLSTTSYNGESMGMLEINEQ
ncbi:MAG: alpha/beta fold hydrolase [Pseudohongiellaceae bacterium]